MKLLTRFFSDIKKGENIDLYITLILATISVLWSLLGGEQLYSKIYPFILIVLVFLTVSMLVNRDKLESIISKLSRTKEEFFLTDFSNEIQNEITNNIRKANDLLIIGVTLRKTLELYYHLIEQKLEAGDTIRIVTVNPQNRSLCETIDKRMYNPPANPTLLQLQVEECINNLMRVQASRPGKLEIRLIDFPLPHGGIYVEPSTPTGAFYLWYHGFKTRQASWPKFVIRPVDGHWYEYFKEEANMIWDNAKPWVQATP